MSLVLSLKFTNKSFKIYIFLRNKLLHVLERRKMGIDLTRDVATRYATAFFFKAVNPAPEEKPIDTWAFTITQKDDWGEMKDDFHNKWGIMDHFRSFGLRHARLVFMYRDRSPEATIGIHKTWRRLRIESQEQWEVAKMNMDEHGFG